MVSQGYPSCYRSVLDLEVCQEDQGRAVSRDTPSGCFQKVGGGPRSGDRLGIGAPGSKKSSGVKPKVPEVPNVRIY